MKMKKQITIGMAVLCILAITGCSNSKTPQLGNELSFSLNGIKTLKISYDEENITFLESADDKLVVKEFMTENKSRYYAKVSERNSDIKISEGNKPLFKDGFYRHIEVYLPTAYDGELTVTSTNGNIDFSGVNLNLYALHIDNTSGTVTLDDVLAFDVHLSSTSGRLELGSIQADRIRLETTSGSVSCDKLHGDVTYTSTSGDADIKSAVGSGNYKANNSGKLQVEYTEVNGNLYFYNKNDKIIVTLPEDLDFEFEATAKNGSILTNFQQYVTINGHTASGDVGDNPAITVRVESNNGDIEVNR